MDSEVLHASTPCRSSGGLEVCSWVESGQAALADDLASTQKSARGALSPSRHSKKNMLWARVAGSTLATEFMSEKADGEINAGGT